jgi:hypothetical protein
MRILVSDPEWVDDLVAYLRRCGCAADVVGRGVAEAAPPRANVASSYLRMELDAYLRVWRAMHSGVKVELVEWSQRETAHEGSPPQTSTEALR